MHGSPTGLDMASLVRTKMLYSAENVHPSINDETKSRCVCVMQVCRWLCLLGLSLCVFILFGYVITLNSPSPPVLSSVLTGYMSITTEKTQQVGAECRCGFCGHDAL